DAFAGAGLGDADHAGDGDVGRRPGGLCRLRRRQSDRPCDRLAGRAGGDESFAAVLAELGDGLVLDGGGDVTIEMVVVDRVGPLGVAGGRAPALDRTVALDRGDDDPGVLDGDGDGGGGVAGGAGGLDAHRVRVERGDRVGAGVGGQDDAALAGRVGVEHDLGSGVPGGGDAAVQGTVHVGADAAVPQPGPAGRGRPVEVGDAGVVHAAHQDQGVTGLHRVGDGDDRLA